MQTRLAWLAGIIDGEGGFTIYHRTMTSGSGKKIVSTQANITITNSSASLITECRALLDSQGVKYALINPGNSARRPVRRIFIRNYGAMLLTLDAVEPHLIAKRAQAALLREFVTRAMARKGFQATDERVGYCARMSALNRTGELIP